VWPNVVVVLLPGLDRGDVFVPAAKVAHAEALVAELPVEALVGSVLPRLARSLSALPIPSSTTHFRIAFDTNSGPLSERMNAGAPRTLTRRASTSTTRRERMLSATSIARHSRVHSSTTVRHLSCLPSAQASKTKSYSRTWFGPVGGIGLGQRSGLCGGGVGDGTLWTIDDVPPGYSDEHNRGIGHGR
jgi:hypothetical protein